MIYLIDEKNKEVFYKLKNSIVGGASIVFHRYHQADETKIKRPVYTDGEWHEGIEGNTVKNITGYDANTLYLWCIGNDMPCGRLKYTEFTEETNNLHEFIESFFGKCDFVEVDIHTREEDYNLFGEFPLIFKNVKYDLNEEVGEYMKEIFNEDGQQKVRKVRKLISSFSGEKILIKSQRLKWLISKGLIVTKIHGYIKCQEGRLFKEFMEKVSEERRKGDVDPDFEIIGNMSKNVGNLAFGRTGMNKNKFHKTIYGNEEKYYKLLGKKTFQDANQYGEIFEISQKYRKISQNIPIQIACSIYDDSKYKMSSFYYDCVDKYVDRSNFQYIEMDTDSAYIAMTGDFDELVKPDMRTEYQEDRNNWFLRTDTKEHYNFDKRTAGLFKPEFIGAGVVALTAKMYYVIGFEKEGEKRKDKHSNKGIQEANNKDVIDFETYKSVLFDEQHQIEVVNKGLRIFDDKQVKKSYQDGKMVIDDGYQPETDETNNNRRIYHYETKKIGLTQKYDKRSVLHDKVSTVPLKI